MEIILIIYKIINLINGKFYIGKDKNNNPNYLGSGIHLKRAIKKYGKENFKKEILQYCNNNNHMSLMEIYWITKLNAIKEGYNIAPGGVGGGGSLPGEASRMYGKMHSEDTKRKIGKANKGRKHSEASKLKIKENHAKLAGKNHPFYGKKHSEKTKSKMRIAAIGRKHSEETKKKMSEKRKGKISPMKGRNHTKETKYKMRIAKLGKVLG